MNTANISEAPLNQENNLINIPKLLATRKEDFDKKEERVKIYEQAVDTTNAELADTIKAQNLAAANANTLPAYINTLKDKKAALATILKNQNAELSRVQTDSTTAKTQVQNIRNQVAERYSKRMIFMFLTAAFILLCIAAVIISITVISESIASFDDASEKHWYFEYWQIIAAGFAILFGIGIWALAEKGSLAVVSPMYSKSIWASGDVSEGLIHFVNCCGFTATIWLVFAANAVLFAVKLKKNPPDETEANKLKTEISTLNKQLADEQDAEKQGALSEQIEKKQQSLLELIVNTINTFAPDKRNITTVLYVGGLMLFVGMLRMKIVADWHLIFVSTESTNHFYTLLNNFFNSLLTVQAGFYSILLMVIYLPVIYAMPPDDIQDTASGSNLLEKLGLPFSTKFLVKAFAVFLPALATPSVDFFNYILGKTG